VDLTGQYSNPSGPLKALLEAASAAPEGYRRPVTPSRSLPPRRRLGAIKRAIRSVLSDAEGPIGARDIHALVEERLERSVSYDNVRKVLSAAARDPSSRGVDPRRDGHDRLSAREYFGYALGASDGDATGMASRLNVASVVGQRRAGHPKPPKSSDWQGTTAIALVTHPDRAADGRPSGG
jgi:hypothetical protein